MLVPCSFLRVTSLFKNLAGVLGGLLFAAAAYAISGGPFGGPGQLNVVGTFAGVVSPGCVACEAGKKDAFVKCKNFGDYLTAHPGASSCSDDPAGCAANSIGVFSVGVPSTGTSSGTFVMFSQGRVFNGTIKGTADPNTATLKAVLSASFNFTLTSTTPCPAALPSCTPSSSSEQVTAMANGNLRADIFAPSTVSGATTATRLKGTATLDISQGHVDLATLEPVVTCEMKLKVVGFKQSDTAAASTTGTGTL
jgi:hypothetical protein